MGNLPGLTFFSWIANLRDVPVLIPKHSAVGCASTDSARIFVFPKETPMESPSPVESYPLLTAANPLLPAEEPSEDASTPPEVVDEDDQPHGPIPDASTPPWNKTPPPAAIDGSPGWHSQVSLRETHQAERTKVPEFLTPFAKMWDGHLGNIRSGKNRIDLRTCSTAVHKPPYRAGQHNHAKGPKSIRCSKWT